MLHQAGEAETPLTARPLILIKSKAIFPLANTRLLGYNLTSKNNANPRSSYYGKFGYNKDVFQGSGRHTGGYSKTTQVKGRFSIRCRGLERRGYPQGDISAIYE